MFLQENMGLMDELASSSEGELKSSVRVQVRVKFTPKGGKDQGAMTKCSRGPRRKDQNSYDKYPYLDHGDNDV